LLFITILPYYLLSFRPWLFNVLQLLTARQVYYFAAENAEAVDRWVKGLLRLFILLTTFLSSVIS